MHRRLTLCVCALAVLTAPSVAGCNTLNGTADFKEGPELTAGPRDQDPGPSDDVDASAGTRGGGDNNGAHPDAQAPDAQVVKLEAGTTVPTVSYCADLGAAFRFDGSVDGARGLKPNNTPNVGYEAGKFSYAAVFGDEYGARYTVGPGVLTGDEGSVSMWVAARNWSPPDRDNGDRIFFEVDRAGVFAEYDAANDLFAGVVPNVNAQSDDDWQAYSGVPSGGWHGGYNHVVVAWSKAQGQVLFVLNGQGASWTTGWGPSPSPGSEFIVTDDLGVAEGFARDDVAIWPRVLTSDEILGIMNAGQSIADTCQLP